MATGLRFPEGPIAMADGSVVLVEIARQTLSRVDPDGTVDVIAHLGGGPNGAALGPDGKVYVCNNGGMEFHDVRGKTYPGHMPAGYSGGSIQRVDLATGEYDVLYTHAGDVQLRGPNDLVFDRHGGFWFTDHGKLQDRLKDRTGCLLRQGRRLRYQRDDLPDGRTERHRVVACRGRGLHR